MVCVMVVLNLMQRYKWHGHNQTQSEEESDQSRKSNLIVVKEQRENEYLYVFGNLLSQGLIQIRNLRGNQV